MDQLFGNVRQIKVPGWMTPEQTKEFRRRIRSKLGSFMCIHGCEVDRISDAICLEARIARMRAALSALDAEGDGYPVDKAIRLNNSIINMVRLRSKL